MKKVPDIDIYPPEARFTIRASFDCVITKVLVSAGTEVKKGQPLYVRGPRRTEDILLNISSHVPSKESKVEYLMIHKILLMNRRSHVGIFSMEDVPVDHRQQLEDDSPMLWGLGNEEDDFLKKFENFRKFDCVRGISDHFFSTESSALNQQSKEWADMVRKDWMILEKYLPETIFVRVDESRMDLLRAVIIGPQGTTYRDGLFFFDLCLPSNYPASPPRVHYHSGGFCIHPKLYKCGKVDMRLPKTTSGQETMWVPGTSNILDLLVSIQNQIFTINPMYNDLTYSVMRGSPYGKLYSSCYNENTIIKSLKTMVNVMNKPPKSFEDFVVGHFRNCVRNVMVTCNRKAYSVMFKDDLALCRKLLVAAFNKIGAKVPEEFLT
uniref:putative ubiquitin-conjugating enzyme E2 38 isoform X2 n=1 Tax=Erigeron canadensis TaxID=72917 RepID=UPI001CB8CEB6|nr:putative ubiquitin-conjugating enzyme E2 38 isoform X2 [Erigeron canadensis]